MEPAYSECQQFVEENNLQGQVIFKGKVAYEDLPSVYKSAALFVYPSSCENCPNILLEAIGCGLPVIASKTEPMPEFAKDSALYFDENDYNDIAHKMNYVLDNPAELNEMRNKSIFLRENYTWEKQHLKLGNILIILEAIMFKNKTLLITGGTGSFGNAVLQRFLNTEINEIRIFHVMKKQDDMRKHFKSDKLKFYIGDVRDYQSVSNAMRGVDYIYHAAALKQVPSCEFYPLEAVKTNVLGTENVLEAAITHGVKRVVCLSTDKAVYPINAMGFLKQ